MTSCNRSRSGVGSTAVFFNRTRSSYCCFGFLISGESVPTYFYN